MGCSAPDGVGLHVKAPEDPALGLSVGTRPWRQGRRGRPAPDPSRPTQLGLPSRPLHFWAHLCPTHGPQRRSRTGKCPGGLAWVGALRQRPECGEEVAGVGKEGPGPQPACIHLVPWQIPPTLGPECLGLVVIGCSNCELYKS